MSTGTPLQNILAPEDRLLMVVGNFGSGKTEVAVNLAIQLAKAGRTVQLADLDLVNPYFRSREAQKLMEAHGIRVVVPPGDQAFADLPIILPEIRGMLSPPAGTTTIFDVGGDDVGARALATFRPSIPDGGYELWQVVNAKRPFTSTVEGCLEIQREIESASRLQVTGLLANAHLMDDTTPATVLEGWRLAREVAEACGHPLRAVAAMNEMAQNGALDEIDVPLLRMQRYMLPPWISGTPSTSTDAVASAEADGTSATRSAPRSIPIGKPQAHPHPQLPPLPRRRAWDKS